MDRQTLRTMVREIALIKNHTIPDTVLDIFLQEGYDKLVHRRKWTWLAQPPETVTLVSGTFDLTTLASDFLGVIELSDSRGRSLGRMIRSEHRFLRQGSISSVAPHVYYIERNVLTILPESTEDFTLWFYGDVGWPAGDAESPGEIPVQWHTTLVNWAVHRVWEREEDFERSDAYLGRYEIDVSAMLNEDNQTDSDGPKIHGQSGSFARRTHTPFLDGL